METSVTGSWQRKAVAFTKPRARLLLRLGTSI
jgi:hypothetical protein